jgi:TatD DNase family protein
MYFIDTHAHLYSDEFKDDCDQMILRAFQSNIQKIIMPNIDVHSLEGMIEISNRYKNKCFAMFGLHPCYVKEDYEQQLKTIWETLQQQPLVAIGEIGLDYYWDETYKASQIDAFQRQMQWALDLHLPVAIHTRNAWADTIETVKPFAEKGLKGVFHCFGGTIDEANEVIELGMFLGIGGVATYKKTAMDEVLPYINTKHIVLETDCPYLSPVPLRGKRNEPVNIPLIAQKIAEIYGTSVEKIARITTENAELLFDLNNR